MEFNKLTIYLIIVFLYNLSCTNHKESGDELETVFMDGINKILNEYTYGKDKYIFFYSRPDNKMQLYTVHHYLNKFNYKNKYVKILQIDSLSSPCFIEKEEIKDKELVIALDKNLAAYARDNYPDKVIGIIDYNCYMENGYGVFYVGLFMGNIGSDTYLIFIDKIDGTWEIDKIQKVLIGNNEE